MKEEKLIIEFDTPKDQYAAAINRAFKTLLSDLNNVHKSFDLDETKT